MPDNLPAAQPREDLRRAVVRAGLANDPLGHAMEALGELVERVELAVENAKAPLTDADRDLARRVLRDVLKQDIGQTRRAVVRQTAALMAVALLASAALAGVGGYYAGQLSVVPDLAWASLIRANPVGPAPVREWTDPEQRTRAGEFRLWLSAPPAIVPPRR